MEVSVVGMDPSALSMSSRDVVISYRDDSANTTYYLQVNPADNNTVIATEVLLMCPVTNGYFFYYFIPHRTWEMPVFFKWPQIQL